MAVFRVEHNRNYTVMSNYHLRDKRLSLKAKGLLSQLISLPEDWTYTLSGLARINAEGRDAIRSAIVELERAGYVFRRQTTNQHGKFSANEYIIRECPASVQPPPDELSRPLPENPLADPPLTGSPATENPTQLNKDTRNKEKQKKDLQSKDPLPFLSEPSAAPAPAAAQPPEAKGRETKHKSPLKKPEPALYREPPQVKIRYGADLRAPPPSCHQPFFRTAVS